MKIFELLRIYAVRFQPIIRYCRQHFSTIFIFLLLVLLLFYTLRACALCVCTVFVGKHSVGILSSNNRSIFLPFLVRTCSTCFVCCWNGGISSVIQHSTIADISLLYIHSTLLHYNFTKIGKRNSNFCCPSVYDMVQLCLVEINSQSLLITISCFWHKYNKNFTLFKLFYGCALKHLTVIKRLTVYLWHFRQHHRCRLRQKCYHCMVRLSVRLSHLYILLKLQDQDEIRWHLTGTLMWSQVTLY